MKMILVTGDTHGDLSRFKNPLIKRLKKGDTLIICGDFGFIWNDTNKEKHILNRLGNRRYNILFVEGVHENFSLLRKYPEEEWCGGICRHICGNLRQLVRGHIFEIEGRRIFAFGGGRSEDNYTYLEGNDEEERWAHESLSDEEIDAIRRRLEDSGMGVDYIVSYEPPSSISEFIGLSENDPTDRDYINSYLEKIKGTVDFKLWFFGRYHINKFIPKKYHALFDNVIQLK